MDSNKIITGVYEATGVAFDVDNIGFMPNVVKLFNKTRLTQSVHTLEMPDASVFKQINHHTQQNVWATSNGITLLHDGFTVGTDSDINTDGDVVYYVAYEGARMP